MQMNKRWDLKWRERRVKDGEWGVEDGEHGVESEHCKVEDGVWRVQMENVGSQVEDTMLWCGLNENTPPHPRWLIGSGSTRRHGLRGHVSSGVGFEVSEA